MLIGLVTSYIAALPVLQRVISNHNLMAPLGTQVIGAEQEQRRQTITLQSVNSEVCMYVFKLIQKHISKEYCSYR